MALQRGPITWPQSLAHNRAEREAGWEAADELELFVAVLAHEIEHASATFLARDVEELRTGNHEPTVRARAWGVVVKRLRKRARKTATALTSHVPS